MNAPILAVSAVCQNCLWESPKVAVDNEKPNGGWYARQEATNQWREHFMDFHMPSPYISVTYLGDEDESV